VLGACSDCLRQDHESDLPHRGGNHIIPGEGSGGGIGGMAGDGIDAAAGEGGQSSLLVEATARP
jgi:hypothetical protein